MCHRHFTYCISRPVDYFFDNNFFLDTSGIGVVHAFVASRAWHGTRLTPKVSALMGDGGVIALTLVTWNGIPVEGIIRPSVDVQPHIEPSDKPKPLAGGKDKPGTSTQNQPTENPNGGLSRAIGKPKAPIQFYEMAKLRDLVFLFLN